MNKTIFHTNSGKKPLTSRASYKILTTIGLFLLVFIIGAVDRRSQPSIAEEHFQRIQGSELVSIGHTPEYQIRGIMQADASMVAPLDDLHRHHLYRFIDQSSLSFLVFTANENPVVIGVQVNEKSN
jgi:hypothetical protein